MSFGIKRYGNPSASNVLVQMVDDHDLEVIETEVSEIQRYHTSMMVQCSAIRR